MMCEGRLAINGDRDDSLGVWTLRRLILTTRRFIQASISRWAGSRGSPCSATRRQRLQRSGLTYHGCLRSEACEPQRCASSGDRAPSAAGCKRLGGSDAAVQRCSSAGWRLAAGMAPTRPESQEAVYHEAVSPRPTLLVARR